MWRKAITTAPRVPNTKNFDEPGPDVTEDAFHLDDLFMLLDYYTLPGGDDWPQRFPSVSGVRDRLLSALRQLSVPHQRKPRVSAR